MNNTIIVGAGLAGLITACKIPDVPIYEAGPRVDSHKALLRFREDSVSRATGIPFKAVRVRKSIWANACHWTQCSIQYANVYSRKVTGALLGDRSIWDLDEVTRYIAPEDFYDRLVDMHGDRIRFATPIQFQTRQSRERLISTIPLPLMMELCDLAAPEGSVTFGPSPINVRRYRLPAGTDLYQTVYFPEVWLRTYRASITGDILIVECIDRDMAFEWAYAEDKELLHICEAFGLNAVEDLTPMEKVKQRYGKIIDIPRQQREAILYELTREFNVFSIGRFATWRNILLDDVVKDIDVVKRLMASSEYGRELVLANR